tara:strand:+ start:169 stop:960 length:792 start_codon:yes stop_codon:yes gene_type:complete
MVTGKNCLAVVTIFASHIKMSHQQIHEPHQDFLPITLSPRHVSRIHLRKMDFLHRQVASYFGLTPRETLIRLLEHENDDRRVMENADLIVVPDDSDASNEVNLYNANMWNVAPLATILRSAGVKTRSAGHALSLLGLLLRLRHVMDDTAPESAYDPTCFGRNKWEYWYPILKEIFVLFIITTLTVIGVQFLYVWSEHFHHTYECVKTSEFFSAKCYVLKKCRSYLEEMNYNLVYTVICGIGLAIANILRKFTNAATANFAVND